MIGSTIAGRYEVRDCLGAGANGGVYRALDRTLGREVAIKVLADTERPDGCDGRLQLEAEALARLRHPGIVAVHDLGVDDGQLYLVMELFEADTLMTQAEARRFAVSETMRITVAIAEAMTHAHAAGIVHRDLSLHNILARPSDKEAQIRIIDFGLGRRTDADDALDGMMVGTAQCLAPEVARGGRGDTLSDVYSFGACIYRLLAGRFPFDSDHLAGLIYQVQFEPPPPLDPAVPGPLAALVMGCLEKDPSDRPQGFAVIAAALAALPWHDASTPGATAGALQVVGPRNPYLNRVMITNPAEFYGRQRELARIFSRLDAPQPQSVSIVGDRRIGKSSLLAAIADEGNRRRYMSHASSATFVYMDFQGEVAIEEERFINLLIRGLPDGMRSCRGGMQANSYAHLEQAVALLDESGRRLIVLMDEFERITKNEHFSQRFFSFLRSLANRFHVAYVTASYAELQDLCHAREVADSPFFNIFSNLPLGPFTPDEAATLVREPSDRAGFPLGAHVPALLPYAGLRPMSVQVACSCLFELACGGEAAEVGGGAFRAAYRQEMDPHFEFIWNRLSDPERDVLARIADRRSPDRQQSHLCDLLRKRGLLVADAGGLRLESTAFAEYVTANSGRPRRSVLGHWWRR